MDGIRAIFFDFGDTLAACTELPYDSGYIESYDRYNEMKRRDLIELPAKDVCEKFMGVSPDNPEAFLLKLNLEHVRTAIYPDTLPVLKELRARGYRMGIISNCTSLGNPTNAQQLGISEYMGAETYSRDVGFRKPRKEIFEAALKKLGVEANESAMVGDSYGADVVGAASAGFAATVLVERRKAPFGYVRPGYVIKELSGLLGIF